MKVKGCGLHRRHTSISCDVAAGNRVVGEKPVAQHGKGVNIHPLVLSEALAYTQHGEEIPGHRPIQLRYGHRLTETRREEHG